MNKTNNVKTKQETKRETEHQTQQSKQHRQTQDTDSKNKFATNLKTKIKRPDITQAAQIATKIVHILVALVLKLTPMYK